MIVLTNSTVKTLMLMADICKHVDSDNDGDGGDGDNDEK